MTIAGIQRTRSALSWVGCASGWVWRAAVALAALQAATAAAQALISPVVVLFGPRQKIATVRITLSDQASRPMRLQAQLLQWRQDLHGNAVTQPSEDLIVTPRIAELQPGQQQVLRVALRGSLPAESEMAYRLVLEDVGELPRVELEGASVSIRMAYDLPVMVPPRGPVVTGLRWRPCPAGPAPGAVSAVCVQLANAGNRHVKVQSITIAGEGWQESLKLKEAEAVLSGTERQWTIPATGLRVPQTVQVQTSGGAVLQVEAAGG